MNPLLEQIFQMLNSFTRDELLHLRDEIEDYLEDSTAEMNQDTPPVKKSASGRISMPRIRQLHDWGAVKDGDRLYVLNHETQPAILIGHKEVEYNGERMSLYEWAKQVSGWKSINIYVSVMLERENRLLWEVRRDAMIAHGMEYPM